MSDGTQFWKLPRRPPQPLKFNPAEKTHLDFVKSFARLYADTFNVPITNKIDDKALADFFVSNENRVPVWRPKNKHIETDESKKKEEVVATSSNDLNNSECADILDGLIRYIFMLKQWCIIHGAMYI